MKNLKTQLAVLLLSTACSLTGAYGQLTPSGDSYTNTADPTTNYGASKLLDVESSQTTYIQFNLSSIPAGYTSADITKATLKLYVNTATKAGSFNVDYVNGTWSESTLDASNAPALGTTIQASIPITTADKNQYILIDITAAVQAWLSGTANDGIALVGNSPVDATFDSKESTTTSHPPELDIVFAGGSGSGITGINTAAGSGLIGGGTSGTLNLSLTNVCAASQILQWNGSAWACASPGTGTITGVTAGTDLTGGGTSGNVTLSLNTSATNGLYAQLASANTFSANQTINGTLTATSSSASIVANTSSATSYAVNGTSMATTGDYGGIWGATQSTGGYGVVGESPYVGVIGSSPFVGVEGTASNTGVGGYGSTGVLGTDTVGDGYGVYGQSENIGVEGNSTFVGVYGVYDAASKEGTNRGGWAGVWGDTGTELSVAVRGTADNGYAGYFANNAPDTVATLDLENDTTTANGGAEVFFANMPNLLGEDAAAVIGDPGCGETSGNIALQLGQGSMFSCSNYTLLGNTAGSTYLNAVSGQSVHLRIANSDVVKVSTGAVSITGTMSATGTKNFRIDHPLDPANKYLYHASIESSEVLNLYSGNAVLDDLGEAVVQLPDWFEVINKDFRYQLTPVGAPGRDIYIAEEVSGGHFKIAGGKPGAKVSWQVSGVRNDAWEKAHPWAVEEDKSADRGHYLTPELYGAPETERIGYMPVPPRSEPIVHHHPLLPRHGNASPPRTPIGQPMLPAPPKIAALPHPAAPVSKVLPNQK
ncbi:MAG: DNRLRE domain-containing protein [Terriglobales bacterium]